VNPTLPPFCFVVMPFGTKPDGQGRYVDFDEIYEALIAPAVEQSGLQPLRADQELVGGNIHKPKFERLILADYAVADLTTAGANIFYALGVRDAVRLHSTVLIGADVERAQLDLPHDRVRPYSLDRAGSPANAEHDRATLVEALRSSREATTRFPVFHLIDDAPMPPIDRLKTDVFRDEAAYSVGAKRRLAAARAKGTDALREVEAQLGPIDDVEAGVLVDLLLSYRASKAWNEMVRLVERLPAPLRRAVLVREQYGFALNRANRSGDAEAVLADVIQEHGPSTETYGLLGRVYKDRWEAERGGSVARAQRHLEQAIDAYRRGFEADWRDAYPGVNAATLMEIRDPGGAPQRELIPVVQYACRRRIEGGRADYWDHATRLELGVLARNAHEAGTGARDALATVREPWEPESTAHNLSLIRESRAERDETLAWADEIERELKRAAGLASRA
jgi:uncharacterized protein DUF4071